MAAADIGHPDIGDCVYQNMIRRYRVCLDSAERDASEIPKEEVADPMRPGYVKLGEGSYKIHSRGADWLTAKATCESEGAHLVVINSEEEAQLVVNLFSHHPSSNADYKNEIWVGVNDIEEEGKFVTVLGEDLSTTGYAIWVKGNPDDYSRHDPNGEDCVSLKKSRHFNDLHCKANLTIVCEAEDTQPTASSNIVTAASEEAESSEEGADPTHPGYMKLGEGSYKIHSRGADWLTAKATCESEGAHLVVINSEEEAQLVVNLFSHHPSSNADYKNEIWVGVNDIEEEGKFVTVLGEDLSTTGYAIWVKGNPDDYSRHDPNGEDCVSLKKSRHFNDLHCKANLTIVCEAGDTQPTASSSKPIII
ncbi:hypothetical protein PR048_000538 [Dryococelus australis]|uniref:C-type lectin domain-containing protein n=1 Tax=Dryococelus australis TaxID=614101 RepID=A0ABQ9IEY3_9NEOP|nr:hypothetical protein PR048_000538 [Dryococelus australis]